MLYAVNGVLKGCAYHPLHCRSCGITVGFNLYTAHKMYAALRGLFCLFKENVSCYLLKSKTVVPAHRLSFDLPSLQGRVEQLQARLVEMHARVEFLSLKLGQLPEVREKPGHEL
ncbi:hypothetical protein FKM82_016436 [Ascaphus truei]